MYAYFGVTCHLHFWQNGRGLTCHCGNTGLERTLNKSQHTKLTLEKEIFSPLLARIRTHNLAITSPAFYQQAIPVCTNYVNIQSVILQHDVSVHELNFPSEQKQLLVKFK